MPSPTVYILRTGRLNYANGLLLQNLIAGQFNAQRDKDFRNVLILTEHNPVYTIGIRTKGYTEDDENRLLSLGAEFFKTNRGGLITFHGPGQLVAYPIFNLKQFQPSVRWYVNQIETTIIDTCKKFGITAKTSPDTGVWVNDNKICAIGIHRCRYVTTHGLALNCNLDLSWFDHIVPCGIEGKGVTSLSKELSKEISIDQTIPKFIESFGNVFQCDLVELPNNEQNDILGKINLKQ